MPKLCPGWCLRLQALEQVLGRVLGALEEQVQGRPRGVFPSSFFFSLFLFAFLFEENQREYFAFSFLSFLE